MMAITLLYGLFALILLAAVAALAYLWRGWKAALIAAVLTFVGLAAAFFILIALVTRSM